MVRIAVGDLETFSVELLVKAGVPQKAAEQCARVLVEADLEGVGTHGVSRLPIYIAAIQRGQLDPTGKVTIVQTGPATATVDGGNTLGPVVSNTAMVEAIELARDAGVGMVTARRSNHYGTAAYYVKMAARAGFIGISTTNSHPAIPPWGAREAYYGTNPIGFAFPTSGDPVVVDLSLSVVARGKVIQAARDGKPIPLGWAIDRDGHDTTDAKAALAGAMLPLGGAKGAALALAIEIFSGILSGAGSGPGVTSILETATTPANVGHWFVAIDVTRFLPMPLYLSQIDRFLQELKALPLAQGVAEIRIPGERRAELRRDQLANGVSLSDETAKALNGLAEKLGAPSLDLGM